MTALEGKRKSLPSLLSVAGEIRIRYPRDDAAQDFADHLREVYARA